MKQADEKQKLLFEYIKLSFEDSKEKKLLQSESDVRQYVKLILEEYAGVKDADSPFGASIGGDTGELFRIFVEPFADAFKVAVAQTKELTTRAKTIVKVAWEAAVSTFLPGAAARYADVFEKEKKELEAIKSEYKDVYNRIDSAYADGDAALLAFMVSPGAFLGYKGIKAGAKIGKEQGAQILSAVTAGYSDKVFNSISSGSKGFGRWLIQGSEFGSAPEEKKKKEKKSGGSETNESRIHGRLLLLKEDGEEKSDKESEYEKLYGVAIEKILKSPDIIKMQEDAKKLYQTALEEVYKQAETVLRRMKTAEDIEKFLGKRASPKLKQSIADIKKLPSEEKAVAEKKVIDGVRDASKDFYVKSLEDRVASCLRMGIPEDSQYIKDYRTTISKIKSL